MVALAMQKDGRAQSVGLFSYCSIQVGCKEVASIASALYSQCPLQRLTTLKRSRSLSQASEAAAGGTSPSESKVAPIRTLNVAN